MKKKWLIVGLIIVVLLATIGIGKKVMSQKNQQGHSETGKDQESQLGLKYADVPDVEQVYINGQVQPERSQAFNLPAEGKVTPVMKVVNNQVVEEGTVLYTIEDSSITSQLEEQVSALTKQEARRQSIIAKWNRDLAQWEQTKEEERTSSKTEINNQYQEQVDSVNEEKQSLNESIANLRKKQIQEIKAEFKGKVSIPEVKEATTPILRLTSEAFFVFGTVNEKDVERIKPEQKVKLTIISNNQTTGGHISAVDLNPVNPVGGEAGEAEQGQSMAKYKVKIALDDLEKVKNGFHMQAAVNIGEEKPIMLPKEAIHSEGETKYVLVNDFGSVIRRTVVTGEEKNNDIRVISGLEVGDRVIVSSKKPVKEGDILNEKKE